MEEYESHKRDIDIQRRNLLSYIFFSQNFWFWFWFWFFLFFPLFFFCDLYVCVCVSHSFCWVAQFLVAKNFEKNARIVCYCVTLLQFICFFFVGFVFFLSALFFFVSSLFCGDFAISQLFGDMHTFFCMYFAFYFV